MASCAAASVWPGKTVRQAGNRFDPDPPSRRSICVLSATGVQVSKKPRTSAIALTGTSLAGALHVGVLLAGGEASWITQVILGDQLTGMRHPLGTIISSEFYKGAIRHDVVRKLTMRMTWLMNKSRLPMIVSAESHRNEIS